MGMRVDVPRATEQGADDIEAGVVPTFALRVPRRSPESGASTRQGGQDLVLVVSEDTRLVEVVRQTLAGRSAPVLHVPGGIAGQRLAAQLHPAVIVFDDRIAQQDLDAALQAFAADPEVAGIPRVVVGALPAHSAARGVRAVKRPLRPGPLLEALQPFLRAPAPLGELLLVLGQSASQRLGAEPFAARGWHVRRATSVAAVRELLARGSLDAVIFDLDIPDARALAELLRSHPGGRRRVVIGVGDPDLVDDSTDDTWARTAAGVCTAVLPLSVASTGSLLGTLAVQVYAAQER